MKTKVNIFSYYLFLCTLFLFSCDKDTQSKEPYQVKTVVSDWYDVTYLGSRTYQIHEPQSSQLNTSFLIIGDKKAIMFDTGSGENDALSGMKIKPILDQLTTKPMTLILSHFHFDHNQNIAEFEHIAFPEISEVEQKISQDSIYLFSSEDLFIGDQPASVKVNELIPLQDKYSLGSRNVRLYNLKGHTDESVIIVDDKNKLVLLGDFIYSGTLYLFKNSDVLEYRKSLSFLLSETTNEYRFYGAHGDHEMSYGKVKTVHTFFNKIHDQTETFRNIVVWGLSARIYESETVSVLIFQ